MIAHLNAWNVITPLIIRPRVIRLYMIIKREKGLRSARDVKVQIII